MMDKRYYTPIELVKIATQHAYCAEHLLHQAHQVTQPMLDTHDSLFPLVSLMYVAFELTLKAYLSHVHRPVKQPKKLSELLELNQDLAFSAQDLQLLKNLTRQQGFRKGVDYELFEDRQQFHIFCIQIIAVYERLQEMMPLELQRDYIVSG